MSKRPAPRKTTKKRVVNSTKSKETSVTTISSVAGFLKAFKAGTLSDLPNMSNTDKNDLESYIVRDKPLTPFQIRNTESILTRLKKRKGVIKKIHNAKTLTSEQELFFKDYQAGTIKVPLSKTDKDDIESYIKNAQTKGISEFQFTNLNSIIVRLDKRAGKGGKPPQKPRQKKVPLSTVEKEMISNIPGTVKVVSVTKDKITFTEREDAMPKEKFRTMEDYHGDANRRIRLMKADLQDAGIILSKAVVSVNNRGQTEVELKKDGMWKQPKKTVKKETKEKHVYRQDSHYGSGFYRNFELSPNITESGEVKGYQVTETGSPKVLKEVDSRQQGINWIDEAVKFRKRTKKPEKAKTKPKMTKDDYEHAKKILNRNNDINNITVHTDEITVHQSVRWDRMQDHYNYTEFSDQLNGRMAEYRKQLESHGYIIDDWDYHEKGMVSLKIRKRS